MTFAERDGRHVLETYRCQFHIYFQEAFTYQIKFVDWQGENLQAANPNPNPTPNPNPRL